MQGYRICRSTPNRLDRLGSVVESKSGGGGCLCICVAEFDGDVPLDFVLEADSVDTRDGLYDSRLAMCDMAYRSNIYRRLSRNELTAETE